MILLFLKKILKSQDFFILGHPTHADLSPSSTLQVPASLTLQLLSSSHTTAYCVTANLEAGEGGLVVYQYGLDD